MENIGFKNGTYYVYVLRFTVSGLDKSYADILW